MGGGETELEAFLEPLGEWPFCLNYFPNYLTPAWPQDPSKEVV